MINGTYFTQAPDKNEKDAINALERYHNQSRHIFYKLDPQAFSPDFSQNDGQYCHALYYIDDVLKGYAGLCGFDGETGECAAIIENDEAVFNQMLAEILAKAKEKILNSLLFIADENDKFLSGLITESGFKYSFSEYRMDMDVTKFQYNETDYIPLQPAKDSDRTAILNLDEGDSSRVNPIDFASTKIARVNGKVAGKMRIDNVNGTAGIYGFVVAPELRGQGWGRKMLTSTIRDLIAGGIKKIYLEVKTDNLPALSLYKSVGFCVRVKFDYYELKMR